MFASGVHVGRPAGISRLILASLIGSALPIAAHAQELVKQSAEVRTEADRIVIRNGQNELPVMVACPTFVLDGQTVGGKQASAAPKGDIASGEPVQIDLPPVDLQDGSRIEAKLFLQWSAKESVLRKWTKFRIAGGAKPELVSEVVLERMDPALGGKQFYRASPQSYPVFVKGFFAGIEYPVASTRVEKGAAILAHRPGIRLQPDQWYESRKAVYGAVPEGRERNGFGVYIARHYPHPKRLHLNYCSWWSTGIPYSEQEILDLMGIVKQKMYDPYGIGYHTFGIDMGWSDPHSIWEVSKKMFPKGLNPAQAAAKTMGTRLGVWISPCSAYPDALDNKWAKEAGYKTFNSKLGDADYPLLCTTDERYMGELTQRMIDMTEQYGVRHFKLDNFRFACPEKDHGHEPGDLAAEATAGAIIKQFEELRNACPDVCIESCAFGPFESPWWLFHVDALLGEYGDDYPYGFTPCPVYHETYTTSRDFHFFQSVLLNTSLPRDQHVCGICQQEPGTWINDAVVCVMRGPMFLASYINPNYISDPQWAAYAATLKWAVANQDVLHNTELLLPVSMAQGKVSGVPGGRDPMVREAYGYAHQNGGRGLVMLRNPWIKPQSYALRLDETTGVQGAETVSLVSLFPQVRVYGRDVKAGGVVNIPLAPYETIVLSIAPRQNLEGLPEAANATGERIKVSDIKSKAARVALTGSTEALGSDWISPLSGITETLDVKLEAKVSVQAPQSQLLVLIEDDKKVADPLCKVWIDGRETPVTISGSDTGWAASGAPPIEHWLFLMADLAPGDRDVRVELTNRSGTASAAVWVWAKQPGKTGHTPGYANALPEPETISLDAVPLLEPVSLGTAGLESISQSRPVEKIAGIFLDALDGKRVASSVEMLGRRSADQSVVLGAVQAVEKQAAAVQRNKSIGEQSMTIFGRHYLRGLGVQAPSTMAVALNGEFKRFQSHVGLDGALNVWDESTLTFQIWVDGQKRWESGKLKRNMASDWADVDVSGAQTLELIVVKEPSQSGRTVSPWANWAEARLLR